MIYKLVMAVHIALYRLTRGRLGGKSIVLLTTTGKRTGQPRTPTRPAAPRFAARYRGANRARACASAARRASTVSARMTNPRQS